VDREPLHCQVEQLRHANWRVRAILHAMVEAGSLTVLECQLPECYMDSREFEMQRKGRGHNGKGLVLDHIVPRLQGGNDRPENLRAIHATCNIMRARGWKMSDEARARISKAAKARGGWKAAVEKRPSGWNVAQRSTDRRLGGRLDVETVRAMRAAYRAGQSISSQAKKYGVSAGTARNAIHGLHYYQDTI